MRLLSTLLILFSLLTVSFFAKAQTNVIPKQIKAKRTNAKITIDGKIDEQAWKEASVASDFVEFRPTQFKKENFETRSIAYFLYDDEGIYIGGFNYESTKDSISSELKGRDGFGNNDFIGIIFDTYKDRLNGFEYFLTPLGEQWDSKIAPNANGNMEDFSWNAVWQGQTFIHNNGWSYEFFIPYAAIRFGKKTVQDWGLNIVRRRQKTGQQLFWNPIDQNVNGFLTQEGYLTGLENIKPPVRLQLSPYFSIYANHYPSNTADKKNLTTQANGGLDLKYGINQAFTLDMTLIPDFGQVQSDNQVLNLTPFEVRFNENRTFFTEGTELFSKGNLFYSRRIGGTPIHFNDAYNNNDMTVIKNPVESKLVNATKISGRTQKGLGIGLLNAVTKPQHAILESNSSKEQSKFETDPLTNYSVLVLDQTLKNNSSISLVNTNVWRSGKDYDANVTAALFDLNDKKNTWNVGGKFYVSNLIGASSDKKTITGYSQSLYFGKSSGRFNFNVWQDLADKKYDPSDMGFFTNNNYLDHGFWAGYKWLKPTKWYNNIYLNFNAWHSRLYNKIEPIDNMFQRAGLNANLNGQLKKLHYAGFALNYNTAQNDFYEPRKSGNYFRRNQSMGYGIWFYSNEAKKYSYSIDLFVRHFINFYKATNVNLQIGNQYRFNNRFSVSHSLNFEPRFNNIGYAYLTDDNVVFAKRKVNTIENILNLKYSFSNKMGLTFRMRHYLSNVENHSFFKLQNDGKLLANDALAKNVNQNFNIFNIDMVYTWQFAPGSFINVVWKNSAFIFSRDVERSYFKNFRNTIDSDQNNNISLRVIYFIDYASLKKKRSK